MASFADASAGWEIFRARDGEVSIGQLNAALDAQGRPAISERTYGHYRKLQRLGYSDYVSINRLDVRHANDSVFDLADRSRYLDRKFDSPGRLLIPRRAQVLTLNGAIGRVSEGFASLRITYSDEAASAARSTKYNKAVLVFEQVDVERAVQIVEAVPRGGSLDLLLEFRSLLDSTAVFGESPYLVSQGRLVLNLGSESSLSRVVAATHTTFDLFESVRGIVDLLAATGTSEPQSTPVPVVRHMEVTNPLEVVIVGAATVFLGVAFVIDKVADVLTKSQALVHASRAEKRQQEVHPLQIQSMQLDILKRSVELAPLLDAITPSIEATLNVDVSSIDPGVAARLEALKDQAVEAAVELQATSASPIELSDEDSETADREAGN